MDRDEKIRVAGGGYRLGGTVGQADAGLLSGGGYTLGGGFWRVGAVSGSMYKVYLPLVMRHRPRRQADHAPGRCL